MGRLPIRIGLFVLLYITSVFGYRQNPLKNPEICGRPFCDLNQNNFNFKPNVIYRYDYELQVRSEFHGSGQNMSDIHVIASVEVQFPLKCEGLMRITNVEVKDKIPAPPKEESSEENEEFNFEDPEEIPLHPKNDDMADELSRYEMRFAFHDGFINELCPHDEESVWVLNIKRGIISSLQNTMPRFDIDHSTKETDISGECDVHYQTIGNKETSLLVQKRKAIETCRTRNRMHSILQSIPYEFRENYAAWPILKSESYCNVSIDHHIYNGIVCFERHLVVPFSNNQSGAVTTSRLSLVLSDEQEFELVPEEELMPAISKRTTLLFDHAPTRKPTHDEIKASREYLIQMCKLGYPDIQRDYPDKFSKFLSTTRLLTHSALTQLLARAGSICDNGKNHVLESLPYISSTASVQVMRDQILKNVVPKETVAKWMASMAFLVRPDAEMVAAAYSLMEFGRDRSDPDFILTPTAVAHTYCKYHDDCHENESIVQMIEFLEGRITRAMHKDTLNRAGRESMLVAIKGMGNIGVINDEFQDILYQIIEAEHLPMEIRLETISIHRRLDCHNTQDYFMDTYTNFTVNTEIRIASYLQVMRCPDYQSIQAIKKVLEEEEVNQVGSYVWSHLTNLGKASSPVLVEVQGLLIDGDLGSKYKMDVRKFSRNYEHSLFFDEYNFGVNSDSNVIFSTDSYLPRTMNLNFTVDLFGESVNLLELSARMEGFEHFVESLFGPKGDYNRNWFKDKMAFIPDFLREKSPIKESDLKIEALSNLRFRRDADDQDRHGRAVDPKEQMEASVQALDNKNKYNNNNPRAAFGMRVFGNDLKYKTIDGPMEAMAIASKFRPLNYIRELLSGREISYTKSGIFLDLGYAVPMTSGIPLSITALGASSVDIRMSGGIEADNFKKHNHLDLDFKVKPSVSLDVVTTMKAEFFQATSGIRVKSNLYSSSNVETKLKVRGFKLVSFQFSLPQERNDVFSAHSELLVMKYDRDIPQKGIEKRYSNSTCTWPVIGRALGLELCADYSMPDVSNTTHAPSLIMSGPISIDVHIDKADATAKVFLFEFRWEAEKGSKEGSFIFQTPNTKIERLFSANLTSSEVGHNMTMAFVNGDITHRMMSLYKNTPREKKFEVLLNLNGQNSLSVEAGYNRTEFRNGFYYYPTFYLIRNDEKIVGLAGHVKLTSKKNVNEWYLDLIFETRKLRSKLMGYVTKTTASVATNLSMKYQFQSRPEESITVEGEAANRSQRGQLEYNGNLKVETTAYPHFNFAFYSKYISALGHIDWLLQLNNAPDLVDPEYTLATRLIFARHHQSQEHGRTAASIEITRPRSKTDLKGEFVYKEKNRNGTEHNVFLLGRYAKGREMTVNLSVLLPRRHLFAVDSALSITVPGLDSCTATFKVTEKARKEYNVDFTGTWFSGHSIAITGLYKDRSSFIKTFHHFKLNVQSPSFRDTLVDVTYSRDEAEVHLDFNVLHGDDPYAIELRYSEETIYQSVTFASVKWKDKFFSGLANMTSRDPKQLFIEIHLDKFRDIHLTLLGLSNEQKKEASVEFKWDANRDPSQKLVLSAEFNTPSSKSVNGRLIFAYPERTFSGTIQYTPGDPVSRGNARLGWSATEAIELSYEQGHRYLDVQDIWLKVRVATPFDGWQKNSLQSGLYYANNLLLLNSSMVWAEDQNLSFEAMADYEVSDNLFGAEFRTALNSTIMDVPTIGLHFKHRHDPKRMDTEVTIRNSAANETTNTYSVKSGWQFNIKHGYYNVSGSLGFLSPYEGCTTGALVTKFSFSDKKQLLGALDFELEDKKFTMTAEGHLIKLTNNMLQINITTPIDRFRTIVGRFGVNDKTRHLVAEVRSPSGALGIEMLFNVISTVEFDVKFQLASPFEALEKITLIALLNNDMVDFQGGWNKVNLGFVGVWRWVTIKDFEYSYRVFTPLENFEDNGVVIKFVKKEALDMEVTLKLAKYKLGVALTAHPKPKLVKELRLKDTKEIFGRMFPSDNDDADNDDEEEEDEDDKRDDSESSFDATNEEGDSDEEGESFMAYIEVDTIVYPTIKGTIDFSTVEDYHFCYATVILPKGNVEVRNRFYFPDYLTMKNTLNVTTPFPGAQVVLSKFQLKTDLDSKYIFGINLNFLNRTEWVDTGLFVNYTDVTRESRVHDVQLEITTPLKLMPFLNLRGIVELEDSIYRGNLTGKTLTTIAGIYGALEADEKYLDSTLGLTLAAPLVPKYDCKLFFRRDLSDMDKSFETGIEVTERDVHNFIHVNGAWNDGKNYLNASGNVQTNLHLIKDVSGAVLVTRHPYPQASLQLSYQEQAGGGNKFYAKASRVRENIHFIMTSPVRNFENVTLTGVLTPPVSSGSQTVEGNLIVNDEKYYLNGEITLFNDVPMSMALGVKTIASKADVGSVTYSVTPSEGNYGKTFQGTLAHNKHYIQLSGGVAKFSPLNWNYGLSVQSSEAEIEKLSVTCKLTPIDTQSFKGLFELTTPWKRLGLERVKIDSNAHITDNGGQFKTDFDLDAVKGNWNAEWAWAIKEHMGILIQYNANPTAGKSRKLQTGISYKNPLNNFQQLHVGAEMNVNDIWVFQTNGSLNFISAGDISSLTSVQLPEPVGDIHRFSARYRGNAGSKDPLEVSYDAKYEAENAKKRLASRGHYRNTTDLQGFFRVEWGPDMRFDVVETNLQMLRKDTKREFSARVATPFYLEDTLTASGSFDHDATYNLVAGKLFIPASNQVGEADIAFASISNTKGTFNTTTPFANITWFKADFDFASRPGELVRYIKGYWPGDTATLNSQTKFSSVNLDRDLNGQIHIDFPVKTRHVADINYSLNHRGELSKGAAEVKYNGDEVLNGKYTCKTESSAGSEKDVIDVEIQNKIRPIGLHYVDSRQYGGPVSHDVKHAELFELGNSKMYNITGELYTTTRETGQDYKFVAIHPNRTVILTSNYDYENNTTKHKSKLELSPTVWFAYDWYVQNLTKADNESQAFAFDLSYPKRSLGASGWYSVSKNTFDSDVSIKWLNKESDDGYVEEAEPKVLKAALLWRNNQLGANDRDNQTAMLSLGHPSFEKDITVKGLWYRGRYDLLRAFMEAEYCDDPDHLLTFDAVIKDNTQSVGFRNYTYYIKSNHAVSELNLDVEGSVGLRPGLYETSSIGQYKRGYLPLQTGVFLGMIDLKGKEVLYEKTSPHKETKFWGKAGGRYPAYTMNATLLDTPESDMVGAFLLDFDEKLIRLDLNLTPDATQNLRLIGHIPDARSASFDLWRDYEDIHVVDIASYIRMNHSRLVTSKIIWRPKMKSDIKLYFKNMANAFYESLAQGLDGWVRDITNEVKDSVTDIWNNADQYTNNFVEDLRELKVLEEDVEALRKFLNSSYQANDFYIKSAVNFTITLIDELALRSHIQNVPKIFTEMWQVMGESGQALRRSVKWIIETVKTSYRKAVELISRILHGESLDQVSGMMQKMVERYDKFIKDLHLSVIKYAENMYNNVVNMLSSYWKKMLQNIEPTIIRILHYVETTLWNASKEVIDFFYKRTNELVESPYFNKVSNFTQDLDKFYKDIMQNDVPTNIKIYSEMLWNFLKDRYFKLVPFSNEINEVYVELKEEIQELQKSKHVEFIILRLREVRDKIEWVADELQLETRALSVYRMMKQKLMHMAQTALQADSRYREAKTKFVFDPDAGLIDLEQKLPMSWHSFNSTPLFEEIPEFKLVGSVQNAFAGTNFSVWSIYYEYKRYMNPDTWLPPFKSQSMVIGSRHYLSFDNHLVGLNVKYGLIEANGRKPDQCSYLLATDWYEKNFTLTLEPTTLLVGKDLVSTRKFGLLTDGELIYIDVVGQAVRIGNSTTLPAKLKSTVVYRMDDILYIESEKGFRLQCNLQYDICTMELEGWYFGKTSGLLGTMNNEAFDDTVTSLQQFSNSDDEFVKSWALNGCSQTPRYEDATVFDFHSVMTCDDLFRNKVSYFASCFPVVDPMPYYRMCIDLMEHSFARVVPTSNPSPKGACTAALAYIEVCNIEKTPLRIPDTCVKCELINGTFVAEGVFVTMEGEAVPKTTDVVFVVEAKECNKDLNTAKSMSSLVHLLETELQAVGLRDNKYAVVAFGGERPFDAARPVVYENKVFSDATGVASRLAHIQVSNAGGNKDIFHALSVANNLNFRPGASKTFILLPCSECAEKDMRFDYSSLLQLMLENGITLHVLTDEELPLEKSRTSKIFYGLDKERAYTKHDLKEYKGSTEYRKQVRLPKKRLNYCSPLAIGTGGSVFTGNKLRPDMKNPIKKFSTIFAKRVAATAVPNACQHCECTGHNSGVAYMLCTACERDSADGFDDYGFEDLSNFGSAELDMDEDVEVDEDED